MDCSQYNGRMNEWTNGGTAAVYGADVTMTVTNITSILLLYIFIAHSLRREAGMEQK